METIDSQIAHFCRLMKKRGYRASFSGLWAEGSLTDCLAYHLDRCLMEGDLDYFTDVLTTDLARTKGDTLVTCAFTVEYHQATGLYVKYIEAKKMVANEECALLRLSLHDIRGLPSRRRLLWKLR